MKHKNHKSASSTTLTPCGSIDNAIARAGREIARSQESARAFLHKAGIVTAKGNLSKKYR